MSNLHISIKTDNAACEAASPSFEVARILRIYADRIEQGDDMNRRLLDANGNIVGAATLYDDAPLCPYCGRSQDRPVGH